MRRASGVHLRLALVIGVVAAIAAVQPASAYVVVSQSGNISDYEIGDEQNGQRGANCIYETQGVGELNKITVRAPKNVHGDFNNNTWVGWRFRIQRSQVGGGGPWSTYFTSSVQKDRANNAIPADGFTRRAWVAPEGVNRHWRVQIVIYWYEPGSQTNVRGNVVIRYEWYKAKKGTQVRIDEDRCLPQY
jgi:hypothetical protein